MDWDQEAWKQSGKLPKHHSEKVFADYVIRLLTKRGTNAGSQMEKAAAVLEMTFDTRPNK